MTPEEEEYFKQVKIKFEDLKYIMGNPPASLISKNSAAQNEVNANLDEAQKIINNLKTGAIIGAGAGAFTGACAGGVCFGPLGSLAGAIIGAISGGLIGAGIGNYLLDIVAHLAKANVAFNEAFGIAC